MLGEISQTQKDSYYDTTYMMCLNEATLRDAKLNGGFQMQVKKNRELMFSRHRAVWKCEKVLEMNSGSGDTTL